MPIDLQGKPRTRNHDYIRFRHFASNRPRKTKNRTTKIEMVQSHIARSLGPHNETYNNRQVCIGTKLRKQHTYRSNKAICSARTQQQVIVFEM